MFDVVLESFLVFILSGLYLYLIHLNRQSRVMSRPGWNAIMIGFALIIFASVLDVTDNFGSLNIFVIIGNTPTEDFLEKVVGYLGGLLFLAYGLVRWMPTSKQAAVEEASRRHAESECEIANIHAEHIIKLAANAIISINSDQKIISINDAALNIFGYTQEEVIGQSLSLLLPKEARKSHAVLVNDYGANGPMAKWMGARMEIRGRRKNGEEFFAEGSITKQETPDGIVYSAIIQDISDRKQADQALQENKVRLEDALESISEGFCLYDKNDRLVVCNNKYKKTYAAIAEALEPGATFEDIIRFGVKQNQYLEAMGREEEFIEERVRKHKTPTKPIEQHLPDGTWLRIEERKTQDGGIVGIRTDITDLKNNEAQLLKYKDDLEDLVAMRTGEVHKKAKELEKALESEKKYNALQKKFVALASHEFRTPLSIIDGAAQRLIRGKDKVTADEVEKRAGKMRSAVSRMIDLIDTTLYASSLDEGKIEVEAEPCDIGSLLLDVCNRQAEISPDHQIQSAIENLPDVMFVDPRLIDQVFTNLLSNAVKYAPSSPLIEVRGWSDRGNALITITDHGLGISKEDLQHMFQRFFRAKTAKGIKGTGIGLSVVKEFTQLHGGSIDVESTMGEGSTFTVSLPIGEKSRNSIPPMEISV